MKPLVSILIPAYNAQNWFVDTLRSAIGQTWPNKEIIIVDDGSTDRTLEIARRFESERIRVLTQENQGAAAARNKALSLCHGDYIQWLDADDLLNPEKIASQIEALGDPPNKRVLLSGSWGAFMYRPRRSKFVPSALWCDLSPVEWLIRKMGLNVYMQTASWLVSRELSEAAGPWDTRLLGDDDGEYFCRVLMASNGVRFVPEAKVYYRSSGSSSLSYIGFSNKKLEAQWLSMKTHIRYLQSLEQSERVNAACVQYLQNWMVFFYPARLDIFDEAREMAHNLGGKVEIPPMSWKYSWIRLMFGLDTARRAQVLGPQLRWSVVRKWEEMLFRLENRKFASNS